MGAWIEINSSAISTYISRVAPLVGAWIEISLLGAVVSGAAVAPLVGAWIEIPKSCLLILGQNSRSPRGSVD